MLAVRFVPAEVADDQMDVAARLQEVEEKFEFAGRDLRCILHTFPKTTICPVCAIVQARADDREAHAVEVFTMKRPRRPVTLTMQLELEWP